MEAPSHIFEDFLPQAVTLARPQRPMISCPVTFDCKHVTTWLLAIAHREVDLKSGGADLFVNFIT